jgi:DNA-binding MarR family transcriptional regulator
MSEEFLCEIENNFTLTPNEIWEYGLKPNQLIVFFRIFMRAGSKAGSCFESRTKIAKACGISSKQVSRAFKVLEEKNMIQIQLRREEGRTNLIRIKPIAHWIGKVIEKPANEGEGVDHVSRGGWTNSPGGVDHMSHRKGSKKNIQKKKKAVQTSTDPPLSELDAIHRKFVRKIEKAKKSEE